jgi:hypothetical protein
MLIPPHSLLFTRSCHTHQSSNNPIQSNSNSCTHIIITMHHTHSQVHGWLPKEWNKAEPVKFHLNPLTFRLELKRELFDELSLKPPPPPHPNRWTLLITSNAIYHLPSNLHLTTASVHCYLYHRSLCNFFLCFLRARWGALMPNRLPLPPSSWILNSKSFMLNQTHPIMHMGASTSSLAFRPLRVASLQNTSFLSFPIMHMGASTSSLAFSPYIASL